MIKEIPLMYTTEMVQAQLDDRKSETRRMRGLGKINLRPGYWTFKGFTGDNRAVFETNSPAGSTKGFVNYPYGKVGDLLWTREAWQWEGDTHYNDAMSGDHWWYKADLGRVYQQGPAAWKPSIHMPKKAARIWAIQTSRDCQLLQSISDKSAIAEGIMSHKYIDNWQRPSVQYWDYMGNCWLDCPRESYRTLLHKIHKRDIWLDNPWVWVVRNRVVSKTGRDDVRI